MAKASTNVLATGVAFVLVAWWLSSRPNCNRGCKTVAEHLLEHGIRDIVLGL
jgi:hypothetical protein